MIQHTVAFRLNDEADTAAFLGKARELAVIEGVVDFQVLRQVGAKNDFTHALSMFFDSQEHYDGYNSHPDHLAFVADVWVPNVAEFIELDYVAVDA
jgi:hypothetical protein